jgi:starvation-inducible DNA-binding protein
MTKHTTHSKQQPNNHGSGIATDLTHDAVAEIANSLRPLLADVFARYLKTKNFHWHMTGPYFRDYHLLLDEQADQIFAMSDDIADRARKIGASTLHSIGEVSRYQRLKDNDAELVEPREMLRELREDTLQLTRFLRATHASAIANKDVATPV